MPNTHYRFLIFQFHSWIFEKTSKAWAATCKNESSLLLARIMVCIETCLPIVWHTFICEKNPPKCCSVLVWIAGCWNLLLESCNSKNFLEHGLVEKITVWTLANRAGGWIHFCMKWIITLNSYQIFKIKNENKKAGDVLFKAYAIGCSDFYFFSHFEV